jgi:hypothetical protein
VGVEDGHVACRFDLPDGVHVLAVGEDGERRLRGAESLYLGYASLVATGEAEEVPGLGEQAFYSQSFRGLAVHLGGGRYMAVAVGGGYAHLAEPRALLADLAALMLARV